MQIPFLTQISLGLQNIARQENLALLQKPNIEPNLNPQSLLQPPTQEPTISDGIIRRVDLERLLSELPTTITPGIDEPDIESIPIQEQLPYTETLPISEQPERIESIPITSQKPDIESIPITVTPPDIETIPMMEPQDTVMKQSIEDVDKPTQDLKGETGKITAYHGSPNAEAIQKEGFSLKNIGKGSGYKGVYGEGVTLSLDKDRAKLYGDVVEANLGNLNLFKPKDITTDIFNSKTNYGEPAKITEYFKSKGYDGIQVGDEIVVFDPANVKLSQPTPPTAKGGEITKEVQNILDESLPRGLEDASVDRLKLEINNFKSDLKLVDGQDRKNYEDVIGILQRELNKKSGKSSGDSMGLVTIINTNKIGEVIGKKTVKDQFGNPMEKYIVRVTKHSGNKKTGIVDKVVDYIEEVNPSAISKLSPKEDGVDYFAEGKIDTSSRLWRDAFNIESQLDRRLEPLFRQTQSKTISLRGFEELYDSLSVSPSLEAARQNRILSNFQDEKGKYIYNKWSDVPEILYIYRGDREPKKLRGVNNFTLDRNVAVTFAGKNGEVREYKINKNDIMWINQNYLGYGEQEVIANAADAISTKLSPKDSK